MTNKKLCSSFKLLIENLWPDKIDTNNKKIKLIYQRNLKINYYYLIILVQTQKI